MHGQLANQQPQAQSVVVTPAPTAVPPVALAPPVNSAPQQSLTLAGTPSSSTPAVDPPAPQQPSSPPRMSSPDMDVDVGGTPEPESMGADDMARDGESDLVVQQLERGLPRWEGLGDFGWSKEKEGSEDRRLELVLAIKGHKDAVYLSIHSVLPLPALILMSLQWQSLCNCARGHTRGNQYPLLVIQRMSWPCLLPSVLCLTSASVPSVSETDRGIEPLLSRNFPAHIWRRRAVRVPVLTRPTTHLTKKLRSCLRKRVGGMNLEATRMGTSCCFKYVSANTVASCPRVYTPSQRLYQALTSPTPPSGPPYVSSTTFASLRAGPGTARPLHSSDSEKLPAVTTFRVSSKDRTFVDEVTYRGWSVKLADWLHLSNPDDPSRPIIAQVFKCYVSDEP